MRTANGLHERDRQSAGGLERTCHNERRLRECTLYRPIYFIQYRTLYDTVHFHTVVPDQVSRSRTVSASLAHDENFSRPVRLFMSRTRTRLFTGVYQDDSGIAIIVSIDGTPREFRHDANGKPYSAYERHTLRAERERVQARERLKAERAAVHADTFQADVQTYLRTLSSPNHRKNASSYLAHWVRAFADRQRNTITDVEIKTVFAGIDKSASTKGHLRRELFQFYRTLNGREGYNPVHTLRAPLRQHPDARALTYDVIERIFQAMPETRQKARLQVMAYTGLPQSLIAKLRPVDLDLAERKVYVRPRRKGAGVEGRELPLSDKGIEALTIFQQRNAFGSFQNRQLMAAWKKAIDQSGVIVPAGTRPYDLRHSFLTEVYRETGDLKAVSELGMHATLEQTARYAKGAVSERATKVIGAVPRFSATTKAAKPSKRLQKSPVGVHSRQRKKSAPKGRFSTRTRS
jgi:integrase